MKASPQEQALLLDVQAVDTQIAQLQHKRRSLPEHTEIAEGKVEWNRIAEELVATQTEIADTEQQVAKAEADLAPVKQRLVRNQGRVDDGSMGAKELGSMLEEIERIKLRIVELEDVQLEVMEKLETANARLEELKAERAELNTRMKAVIAKRDEQVAQIDAELADLTAERSLLVKDIPADVVALYDKIRERSSGIGVGKLEGKRCSGCHLDQTATAMARYAAAAPDDIVRCEECDRILVR
ncbi:MAG: nucleic acid-binding protein [Propionibacteriaceae bacterium]|jgi:predicted  nucleic acid-binding Zn-ribbon protein|nr:nucleic acid-binding protein [Propionibacteriaceae bacterium]